MKPVTINCKKCGHVYTAYMTEFAVCPKCGTSATTGDKNTIQARSDEG